MTPQDALIELLARVGEGGGAAVFVSEHELSQWPDPAVAAMKAQRLLTKASPTTSAVCPGCERECVMPVHVLPNTTRNPAAFIVCDKRSDINRVAVAAARLAQWQCSADAASTFVTNTLGLRRSTQSTDIAGRWTIGIASGNKRSQMLCLQAADGALALVAGENALPLADLIEHRDGAYSLDGVKVRLLIDAATTADNRYTPSNAKREARKLDTQAMYADWQKAYRELKKKKHKDTSETWYSQQIAKMPVAKGRKADTIKKHMKP